ncbi:MAG: L,D-transpeptidase family protein [Campylobacterota bacterium]|nr:L,D-transpeptidase family protein [Campylobacterota bacterium]
MLKIFIAFLLVFIFATCQLSANRTLEVQVNQIAKDASAKVRSEVRNTIIRQMRVVEEAKKRHRRLEEAEQQRKITKVEVQRELARENRRLREKKAKRVRYSKKQKKNQVAKSEKRLSYYDSKLLAKIDISSQRMHVYLKGNLLHSWKVSTGRKGFYTPTGNYKPGYMTKMHYSKKYDNAAMPYSVFFKGGYAIHGTKNVKRLGRKASHGCIRLRTSNAKELYTLIKKVGKGNSKIKIVY